MNEKKINLEDIFTKLEPNLKMRELDILYDYKNIIHKVMLEFGKQLLALTAQNAEIDSIETSNDSSGFIHEVNKQSIIDTIKLVEDYD